MGRREGVEGACQGRIEILQGTGGAPAQMRFELGESQLNGD